MINDEVVIGKIANSLFIQIDPVRMTFLADDIAVSLIKELEVTPYDRQQASDPGAGIEAKLLMRLGWERDGMVARLEDFARFLYSYVKYLTLNPHSHPRPDKDELQLYAEALSCFQVWKTNVVKAEKKIHGQSWGDATEFNKAVWTDLNDLLLNPE